MSARGRGGSDNRPGDPRVPKRASVADVDGRREAGTQATGGTRSNAAEAEDPGIDGDGARHRVRASAEG